MKRRAKRSLNLNLGASFELKFGGFLEFPIKNMKRNVELVG
jgi:hypothetical protein